MCSGQVYRFHIAIGRGHSPARSLQGMNIQAGLY
jgi:hypothetical protein